MGKEKLLYFRLNDLIEEITYIKDQIKISKSELENSKNEYFYLCLKASARVYPVSIEDIMSKSRLKGIIVARVLATGLMNKRYNQVEIARYMEKDRSTITHAVQRHKTWCEFEDDYHAKFITAFGILKELKRNSEFLK